MKLAHANAVREHYVEKLKNLLADEDLGQTASNTINFPVCCDEEEGWVEIVVKVVKDDEGYEKRQQYVDKCNEKKEKAKKQAELKAKKIAYDQKVREQKAKEKLERAIK